MAHVDSSQIAPLYASTTPGITADATPFDPAIAALVVAINENFDLVEALKAALELPVADQSVTTRILRNLAVTNPKLAPLAVTADKIADGSITLSKLADLVITAAKIADGTITEPKYADGSVSSRVLGNAVVKSQHIDPGLLLPYTSIAVQQGFDHRGIDVTDARWGAKGDGVTDDTIAIQSCLDYAFNNNVLKVIFPVGIYKITNPLILRTRTTGEYFWDGVGVNIEGQHKAKTKIIKYGSGTLSGISAEVNGIDSLFILYNDVGGPSTGIVIKNMFLDNRTNNTNTESMVITGQAANRMVIEELTIYGQRGIVFGLSYSNSIRSLVLKCVKDAIVVTSGTSTVIEKTYAIGTIDPYQISSAYTSLITLFGDNCKGTVYKVSGMNIVMIGCGTESPNAQYIVRLNGGSGIPVKIDSLYFHRQVGYPDGGIDIDSTAVIKVENSTTSVDIGNMYVVDSTVIPSGTGYLFESNTTGTTTAVRMEHTHYFNPVGNSPIKYSKQRSAFTDVGSVNLIGAQVNMRRNYSMPYIGSRRMAERLNSTIVDKAIYLDNADYRTAGDGTDNRNESPYNKGDVLLVNDPSLMNRAAYIVTAPGTTVNSGTYANIPIVQAVTTAERATTNLYVGLQQFDTTIGKPIWMKTVGTQTWVDNMSLFVSVPASATATGVVGNWSADANYMYVCHATNTWKRVAIATW